ncbi:unnamed protein product [Paramecium octaurelia]|uniref:Uncharacterized protein n=1 Tax=Paramecium octaurelia TaxID=43137 RepID=A0A8S1XLW8_PAROT|nr:unnamed protein product [Paramecium octaurelia]
MTILHYQIQPYYNQKISCCISKFDKKQKNITYDLCTLIFGYRTSLQNLLIKHQDIMNFQFDCSHITQKEAETELQGCIAPELQQIWALYHLDINFVCYILLTIQKYIKGCASQEWEGTYRASNKQIRLSQLQQKSHVSCIIAQILEHSLQGNMMKMQTKSTRKEQHYE